MKKVLGYMAMVMAFLLPVAVHATTGWVPNNPNCTAPDADGVKTCTVTAKVDTKTEEMQIVLSEFGGADIQNITNTSGADYIVSNKSESNNVWTVLVSLNTPEDVIGEEVDLFTFTYKVSTDPECKITVKGNDVSVSTPTETTDTPGEQVDTGSTLPYIALGSIALIAVGAYVTTKNKSKMYKI